MQVAGSGLLLNYEMYDEIARSKRLFSSFLGYSIMQRKASAHMSMNDLLKEI
jgi:hypothetical protein